MKVAYLFSRYPVPSQTFCDTEIRALEEAGVEVDIFSISPPPTSFRHGAEGRPRHARVHYLPPPPALEVWGSAARRLGQWPTELIAEYTRRYGAERRPERHALHAVYLLETLRSHGIEHLHVHFTNHATQVAAFVRALGGVPFSFTAHAQDFMVDLGSDDLLRELCERAAFIVTVSNFSRELLVGKCPASAAKIHRIYNGLLLPDQARTPPLSMPSLAGEGNPLRIFSVGRLIEFKGFQHLIEACAILRDQGVPFSCEIVGDGPLQQTLARQIEDAGLVGKVHLCGLRSQAEVQSRMQACDIFALACRVDAAGACDILPTVILEAMAASRPVVSTRLAGIPEMVDDGRTGLLVAPGDSGAFADALAALATDPQRRTQFGEAGHEKLRAQFSAADSSRQLAELFARSKDSSPRETRPATVYTDGAGVACLFAKWSVNGVEPESGFSNFALLHLHAQMRGTRLMALQANQVPSAERVSRPVHPLTEIVARMIEFFPDAMVLEAEWREQGALAHLLESWRKELGNGFRTEDFLLAARRALYFSRHSAGTTGVRHLHAVGAGALLPTWLLLRLGSAKTASFLLPSLQLPAGGILPEAALRRLAPHFVRGWIVGKHKLAESVGPAIRGDDLPPGGEGWQMWATTLRGWAEVENGISPI